MVKFILNNNEVSTALPAGTVLLDFIRYHKNLPGTKIGCREGDCGACTVLVGELKNEKVTYRSFTSCLTPIANVHGKHVVTVEGINMTGLNVVQQAMVDSSATQCGFCTPGFAMSLTGFCLSGKEPTIENAIASVDGNICRCTGYKSIQRAAGLVAEKLQQRNEEDLLTFVTSNKMLPNYFLAIKNRLEVLTEEAPKKTSTNGAVFIGGGTDLYVQKHDEISRQDNSFLFESGSDNVVNIEGDRCVIKGVATVTDLAESNVFLFVFPHFKKQVKLVSSTPIRNMATVAGNFVNASPIGDFTIFFLALDAHVVLSSPEGKRDIPLRKFYKGYKQLDKSSEEFIEHIWFTLPSEKSLFNFEKVSKRTHLDIASVNSAIAVVANENFIAEVSIAAGGVGPIPTYLQKTSEYLQGKELTVSSIYAAIEIAQTEVTPISDARGTEAYKRILLSQLIKAHFITLFPALSFEQLLTT